MPMRDVMALDQARARFREDQLLREADLAGHQFASWVTSRLRSCYQLVERCFSGALALIISSFSQEIKIVT